MEEEKKPEDMVVSIKPDDCKMDIIFTYVPPKKEEE